MIVDFGLTSREYAESDKVLSVVMSVLANIRNTHPESRIGYVAGKVTADGPDNISANLARLHSFTKQVHETKEDVFVFSAADIFVTDAYWRANLSESNHTQAFYQLWKQVVASGVTDVYMTPDWEKSLGACDEHAHAKELGLIIHYL